MQNWKTTLGGILAAVGSYLVSSQAGVLHVVGQVFSFVGTLLLGVAASDAKKSK
jgi:urea transporter